ncbi:hypothetical protein JCM11491_000570 [Sporobolomyces phaffii]
MPPQRPDLVGLLQQSYQQYCLQLLKAFDNEETQAIIRAHGGEDFKCGPLVFIGHVLVGVAQIFWMQKVWSGDKLVSDTDRLGRGDPESPHVSYAKIAILGGPGSSVVGGYEAVVCSAIAQDPYSGRFHPWTAADPVLLPFGSYSPPWPLPGVHGLAVVPPRHPDRHLPHPWGPHTSYALSHRQRHNYGQTHARGGTRSVMD